VQINDFAINITSHDPERLFQFYRDVVKLEPRPDMGDHALRLGGATLFVDGHSETHGPAKEPQRMLLDIFVGDIDGEQRALESRGITFIRNKGREYWGGIISTFADPDGNYVQLIEYKPEAMQTSTPAAAPANA
jgi:predicted enzyme related to lactoylglutathione lyase